MNIYVVVSNSDFIKGFIEGAFVKYSDALEKMKELVEEVKTDASGCEFEDDYDDKNDNYVLTNLDADEFIEIKIVKTHLRGEQL